MPDNWRIPYREAPWWEKDFARFLAERMQPSWLESLEAFKKEADSLQTNLFFNGFHQERNQDGEKYTDYKKLQDFMNEKPYNEACVRSSVDRIADELLGHWYPKEEVGTSKVLS